MHHNQLIIFDLDDTLVDTSDVYWRARKSFVEVLQAEQFNSEMVIDIFEEVDSLNMEKLGFSPHRYMKSMLETYDKILLNCNRRSSNQTLDHIRSCGRIVLEKLPQPIEGAQALLEWASAYFKLAILTRGENEFQRRKLHYSGLIKYFDLVRVVTTKDANKFESVIKESGSCSKDTWIIGDSIKSDINPGIEVEAKCILYVYTHHTYYWRQEYGFPPEGPFYMVYQLKKAIDILKSPQSFEMINELPEIPSTNIVPSKKT